MCLSITFFDENEDSFRIWFDVLREIEKLIVVNSLTEYREALSKADAVLKQKQFAHEHFGGRISSHEAQILSTFRHNQKPGYPWVIVPPVIPWRVQRTTEKPFQYAYTYDEYHTRREKYYLKFDQIFDLITLFDRVSSLEKISIISQDFVTEDFFGGLSRITNIEKLVVNLNEISSTSDYSQEKAEGVKEAYLKHYPPVLS